MIHYLAPEIYCSEDGALNRAGELIAPLLTDRLLIVAGKTALSLSKDSLLPALDRAGIAYTIEEYGGYPTYAEAKRIAGLARNYGAGAVAGLGGGRILDTAKAAGTYAALPVITMPTIAATCACWAAVSVMYDAQGIMDGPLFNARSPRMVIADLGLIAQAPARFIRAGIADTLAKWYEAYPNLLTSNDFYLRLTVSYGKFAREILEDRGAQVADALERGEYCEEDVREIADCVFAVAGLCGAVRTIADTQGIAHPFYNACSALPETRGLLHGEKVAFGLVAQALLEGRGAAEISHRIGVFKKLKIPLTLRELGLEPDFERKFTVLERRLRASTPRYPGLLEDWNAEELRQALLEASARAEAGSPAPAAYKNALDGIQPFKPARSLESAKREFGLKDILKLAGNENLYGTSPKVIDALERAYGELSYYPDTGVSKLRDALARKLKVSPDELLFGNGSFELISIAALAALEDGAEALIPQPSFGWYGIVSQAENAVPVFVPLKDHRLDLEGTLERIRGRTRLIWLCNPNNPTGTYINAAELEAFLARVPPGILVVLDEAYIDFAPPDAPDALALIHRYRNLLSLRTFSKVYGLASLRLGYALGDAGLIGTLSRVRSPVNVNALAQAAALAALEDDAFYRHVLTENQRGRELYYAELDRLGLRYLPTAGNFIMFDTGRDAALLELEFLKRGILVRNGAEFGMPACLRVTIGTEEQNRRVIGTLEAVR